MTVKVEACWNGRDMCQRITMPDGSRETIRRDAWDRKAASEAIDLLEHVYGFGRRNVRFDVH